MYLVLTGWLLARSLPQITSRSVPIQSLSEQVAAATPRLCFIAVVLAAWQRRASLSTLLVPSARATFCAT